MSNLVLMEREQNQHMERLRSLRDSTHDRDLTEAESTEVDDLKTKLDKLTGNIRQRRYLDSIESQQARPLPQDGEDRSFAKRCKRFDIAKVIAKKLGFEGADKHDLQSEAEIEQELRSTSLTGTKAPVNDSVEIPLDALPSRQTREQEIGVPASGGHLSAAEEYLGSELIRPLRPMLLQKMGVRMLQSSAKKLTIPRQTGRSAMAWLSEKGAITAPTDLTFDQIDFEPHKVMSLHQYTNFAEQFSSPTFSTVLAESIRQDHELEQERVFFVGGKDQKVARATIANEPMGIVTRIASENRSTSTNGLALNTQAAWKDLFSKYATRNLPGMLMFVTTPQVKFDNITVERWTQSGAPLWTMNDTVLGVQGYTSTNFPLFAKGTGTGLSGLILGSFDNSYMVTFGSSMSLLINPYGDAAYRSGSVQIRALSACDTGIRYSNAFIVLSDIIAS